MSEATERVHLYHAEATVLGGHLRLPLSHEIKPQAYLQLPAEGGYFSQRAENFRVESVLSFRSAYTHVAGYCGVKPGEGWTTLTTTVVEGLNILDVLTADRIVGQTITDHPLHGYVPSISFLGTRFENLRIAGHPVTLELDHEIFGSKPAKDAPYTKNQAYLSRVAAQYDRIRKHKDASAELKERYNQLSATLGKGDAVECSLVNQASGHYPGHSCGHVITIPHFGVVTLGKLTIHHEDFHPKLKVPKKTTVNLTMVHLHQSGAAGNQDGAAKANVSVGTGSSNGGPK